MRQQSLAIVGLPYANVKGPTRRFEAELCVPGEPVEFRPEPMNPYDEHAIAVFSCRGVQLGYLKSERAVLIGTLWRQGRETQAVFQGLDQSAAWVRLAFDGEKPTLPGRSAMDASMAIEPVDDPTFWPDPTHDE